MGAREAVGDDHILRGAVGAGCPAHGRMWSGVGYSYEVDFSVTRESVLQNGKALSPKLGKTGFCSRAAPAATIDFGFIAFGC
jgi:hypothetical protein